MSFENSLSARTYFLPLDVSSSLTEFEFPAEVFVFVLFHEPKYEMIEQDEYATLTLHIH